MKAWRFEQFGGPEVVHLEEVDTPRPGPGEVLVEVEGAGLNPMDLGNLGGAFNAQLPRTPGRDLAGTVVGGDLDGVAVWGTPQGLGTARDGSLAEHVSVPVSGLARRPEGLAPSRAAALGIPVLTAWCGVVVVGGVRPGETVLVTGVTGSVGRMAAQVAAWSGARVIGTSRHSSEAVRGVETMLQAGSTDLAEAVEEATGGHGADLVLDTVGGELFAPAVSSLANPGRHVAIASSPPEVTFHLADLIHGRRVLLPLDTLQLTHEETARALTEAGRGFDSGDLAALDVAEWSFDEADQAVAALASPPEERRAQRQVVVR